jgi:hypothetical protein
VVSENNEGTSTLEHQGVGANTGRAVPQHLRDAIRHHPAGVGGAVKDQYILAGNIFGRVSVNKTNLIVSIVKLNRQH